jgi:hypothetical protein
MIQYNFSYLLLLNCVLRNLDCMTSNYRRTVDIELEMMKIEATEALFKAMS